MTTYLALAGAAFVAGAIDAISGGGGLIVIPALLASGIDPVSAIATSKLQSSFGSGGALLTFARKREVDFHQATPVAAWSFAGGLGGARMLQWFPPTALSAVMPLFLVVAACFFSFTDLSALRPAKAKRLLLLAIAAFVIGTYDGFFGPGAGAFYVMAALSFGGASLIGAIAQAKYFNVMSNLAALAIYIGSGHVLWRLGLVMAGASLLGGQLGTHLAIRFRAGIAKPLLVLMSLAFAVKLLPRSIIPW